MNKKDFGSDEILKRLFEPKPITVKDTLEDLFVRRLIALNIPKTTALHVMGMTTRTLDGILKGDQKMLDYTQLIKLSNFLGVPLNQVGQLYLEKLQEVHSAVSEIAISAETINFVNEKFNLAELRKVGLIKSLTNYEEIISSICNYFGLRTIFDYSEPELSVAFSAGIRAKKNSSVKNWIYLAERTCIELRNPNIFDREKLIDYFPQIRWQSTDVENGLINVIKDLFQLGVSVVFIPSFPSLHVRGATFSVNDKPCIALTDYVGFYPTLWFALIHELYHVLFDWDEILLSDYHITQDSEKGFDGESQSEKDADSFARKYLFSKEKTVELGFSINNPDYIRHMALLNNVDPSFVYVFYAADAPRSDKFAWGRAKKFNPDITRLKSKLQHKFQEKITFSDHIKRLRNTIYN